MSWSHDDDFKGPLDDFFDDLLTKDIDLPLEDIDATNGDVDWNAKFQALEPPPMDIFSNLTSEFTSSATSKAGPVGIHKTVPILKQTNSSEALPGINSTLHESSSPPQIKVSKLFQSPSPVSVLESNDSSFSPQNSRLTFPVKGMRSKRKRPTTLRFRHLLPFDPRKAENELTPDESEAKKKVKIKLTTTHRVSPGLEANNSGGIVRKCTHCETTKTPQWREGPSGPKTLCNACGVRFRSGRLVPEYRPASSPSFIPSVHSNSHRKIIEMRRKDDNQMV